MPERSIVKNIAKHIVMDIVKHNEIQCFHYVLLRPPRPRLLCNGSNNVSLILLCSSAELHLQPSESMGIVSNEHNNKHRKS